MRYWLEKKEINQEAQRNNYEIIKRVRELKRQKIYSEHQRMAQKNMEAKKISNLYQCHLRSQTVISNREREETEKLLMKMRMKNPANQKQRQELLGTIKIFNEQMSIGLTLHPANVQQAISSGSTNKLNKLL
jgi:hypothetical protein